MVTSNRNAAALASDGAQTDRPARKINEASNTLNKRPCLSDGEAMSGDVPISWHRVRWLLNQGVPSDVVAGCVNLRTVGDAIAFYEGIDDDVVLWWPRSGELVADRGRAFALGGSELSATSGVMAPLRIYADPLDWLRAGASGLVVVDWRQAFDRLRDVPRIAVAEAVLFKYRRAMQPRVPQVAVITAATELAA